MESPTSKPSLFLAKHNNFIGKMHEHPTTRGQTLITHPNPELQSEKQPGPITSLTPQTFLELFTFSRRLSSAMSESLNVRRCALASDDTSITLIPLHGIGGEWEEVLHAEEEFHGTYPGFLTSKTAPRMPTDELTRLRDQIAIVTGVKEPYDYDFQGEPSDNNLFARIVRGEIEQYRMYEDSKHVGFLTPFANTPGYTVLVPRVHLSSDIFSLEPHAYEDLVGAAYKLAGALKIAFGVKRVGVFFEGFEIDYAHVKLIPVWEGEEKISEEGEAKAGAPFYEAYPGYITTQWGPRERDVAKLEELAEEIRRALEGVPK
ncbi:hypothetical protein V5O48_010874 [Marasmius crinis-equi]|uniref:HIT domain-containing protein n=1 Tax=Marasmius crinis-equi TaxID=585013 RepID=A0ABR3F764_9AGAR